MKKFLFILMAFVATMVAKAEDYELYAVGTVTPNGENTISLMIKNKEPLQMVQGEITTPAGFRIKSVSSTCAIAGDGNYVSNGNFRFLFNATTDVCIPASNEPQEIAKLTVTCTDLPVGQIQLINTGCLLAMYPSADPAQDSYEDIISYVKVQKAAVIDELPEGYALEVIPFVAQEGQNDFGIMFKAPETIKDLSFDITLPKGMFLYNSDYDSTIPVANTTVVTAPATGITITPKDEQSVTVKISGNKLKKTGVSSTNLAKAFSLSAYLFSEEEGMGAEYAYEPNSVQTIKISNITMANLDGSKTVTGESVASIIYGQPSAQEAILYGHYTSDAVSSFNTALKNVAIADVTAATVDAKFKDVIVNTKDGSYYSRTSANYGTTCLPYSLTGEYYTVKEMTASSIILEEVSTTTPNEPYIFKGTIDATDANQVTTLGAAGQKRISATTFKGTYSATKVAAGEGYYISSNGKFYSDGATVRPLRAYFDGAVAGVKSFNVLIDSANGLIDITDQLSEDAIYSLQGIRMNNAQKGIIIKGGKKVYVK